MSFSVRIENLDALFRERVRLGRLRDGGAKVTKRAAATLKRRLVPEAKRQIIARFNIKKSNLVKRMRCIFDFDGTGVSFTAFDTRAYLKNFEPTPTPQGIVVSIERGKQLSLPHAFMRAPGGFSGSRWYKHATALCRNAVLNECLSGGGGWVQAANVPGQQDKHGYPISMLLGPSVADMIRAGDLEDHLDDFAQKTFAAEVDRLLEYANGG